MSFSVPLFYIKPSSRTTVATMRFSLPNTTAILALFMGGSLADLTNSGV